MGGRERAWLAVMCAALTASERAAGEAVDLLYSEQRMLGFQNGASHRAVSVLSEGCI